MGLQGARLACVLNILGGAVFHAEQNTFQQVQGEDGEPLEDEPVTLLGEAKAADKGERHIDVLDKGKRMVFKEVGPDLEMEDRVLLQILSQSLRLSHCFSNL